MAVLGAGLMGAGIAQVSAEKGMTVLLKDRQEGLLCCWFFLVASVAWCFIQATGDRPRCFLPCWTEGREDESLRLPHAMA